MRKIRYLIRSSAFQNSSIFSGKYSVVFEYSERSSSSKTNNLPSPSIGGKYSTIGALIKPHRPLSQLNTSNDDELDN
jgi:hypothetical protein